MLSLWARPVLTPDRVGSRLINQGPTDRDAHQLGPAAEMGSLAPTAAVDVPLPDVPMSHPAGSDSWSFEQVLCILMSEWRSQTRCGSAASRRPLAVSP